MNFELLYVKPLMENFEHRGVPLKEVKSSRDKLKSAAKQIRKDVSPFTFYILATFSLFVVFWLKVIFTLTCMPRKPIPKL